MDASALDLVKMGLGTSLKGLLYSNVISELTKHKVNS